MPLPPDLTSAVFVYLAGVASGVLLALVVNAAAGLVDKAVQ